MVEITITNEQMLRPMGGAKYKLLRRYGVVPNVVRKRPPLERRSKKDRKENESRFNYSDHVVKIWKINANRKGDYPSNDQSL